MSEPNSELVSCLEAVLFASPEPVELERLAQMLGAEKSALQPAMEALMAACAGDERGIEVRYVAGGYRMLTKAQHHESVRKFLRGLKPPLRLSLPALETLAVIAYRQPVTAPEIKDIRGVDASGVLNTLLEKKLITTAGRKDVVGKPILYRTTRDFLLRFGLGGLKDLPTMKEFEEMVRAGLAGTDGLMSGPESAAAPELPGLAPESAPDPAESAEPESEA